MTKPARHLRIGDKTQYGVVAEIRFNIARTIVFVTFEDGGYKTFIPRADVSIV